MMQAENRDFAACEGDKSPEESAVAALMALTNSSSKRTPSRGPTGGLLMPGAGHPVHQLAMDENSSFSSDGSPLLNDYPQHQFVVSQHFQSGQESNQPPHDAGAGACFSIKAENGTPKKRTSRDPQSHRISEKRRRERINTSLANLRSLIPRSFMQKGLSNRVRVEKTEIIQAAFEYIKHLQSKMEPLLVDSADVKSAEAISDKLFTFCQSTGKQMAGICLRDRFTFHQLGYQACLEEVTRFLSSGRPDVRAEELLDYLGEHKENLDIGVISKHMKRRPGAPLENVHFNGNGAIGGFGAAACSNYGQLNDRPSSRGSSCSTMSSNTLTTDDYSSIDWSIKEESNDSLDLKSNASSTGSESSTMPPINDKRGSATSSNYVQAFILDPGSHQLIPFHIEAPSFLGGVAGGGEGGRTVTPTKPDIVPSLPSTPDNTTLTTMNIAPIHNGSLHYRPYPMQYIPYSGPTAVHQTSPFLSPPMTPQTKLSQSLLSAPIASTTPIVGGSHFFTGANAASANLTAQQDGTYHSFM